MYIKACLLHNFIVDIIDPLLNLLYSSNLGFIDQLKPEAELGCHPFHITLIGSIDCNIDSLRKFLSRWRGPDVDYVSIVPINKIKISKYGKVILLINSETLQEMGHHIHSAFEKQLELNDNKLSKYYTGQYLHITLGVITNKDFYDKDIEITGVPNRSFGISDYDFDY